MRWLSRFRLAAAFTGAVLFTSLDSPAEELETLVVLIEPGSPDIDAPALRDQIARELHARVVDAEVSGAKGTLRVATRGRRLTVTYAPNGGAPLTRSVELPADGQQRVETIALLAGNLARDEAADLVSRLKSKPEEAASIAPRAGAEAQTSPPASGDVTQSAAPSTKLPEKRRGARPSAPVLREARASRARELPSVLFDASLFHPAALHPKSHELRVGLELAFLHGRVGALSGFGASIGSLWTEQNAQGASVAGIWTRTNGDCDGVFATGLFATSGGRLRGVEAAGLFAWRSGAVRGAGAAGLFTHAGDVEGLEAAGLFDDASALRGVQAAGLFTRAADVHGLQAAGLFNLARDVNGLQAAGVFNWASDFDGLQLSIVNIGGGVRGAQIGLVNVAGRVSGLQLGLVNRAERVDGLSLAPVSILKENRTRLLLWSDTVLPANAGIRYSSDFFYSEFGIGGDPIPLDRRKFAPAVAVGVQLARWGELTADADLLYRYILPESTVGEHSTTLRGVLGWNARSAVGLFAAAGLEHRVTSDNAQHLRGYAALGFTIF